jgi:hypothetical protein
LENQVSSLESYHSLLLNAGFEADSVAVERTTERQIVPYFAHVARAMRMLPPQAVSTVGTTLSPADMSRLGFMLLRLLNVADCVVVTADKR